MTLAAWSSYKPTGGETYPRAQKLANFVAPRYISGGSPIAVVQAQPLFFQDQVVDGVAFTRAPFQDVGEHYHQLEPAGHRRWPTSSAARRTAAGSRQRVPKT